MREDGQRVAFTHAQLAAEVAGLQQAFKAAGIGPGDRIAAIMPNSWQTLVAMLACTSLGAVWSTSSPEFGLDGIIDRFGQIEPKLLLVCAGYQYAGKSVDQVDKINQVCARLPGLQQLIVVPYTRPTPKQPNSPPPRSACGTTSTGLAANLHLLRYRSTTRCTFSIPAVPQACPNASSIALAGCCCSTSRNTACTMT